MDHLEAAREYVTEALVRHESISDDEALARWAWNLLDDLHEGGDHEQALTEIVEHLRDVGHEDALALSRALRDEITSGAARP